MPASVELRWRHGISYTTQLRATLYGGASRQSSRSSVHHIVFYLVSAFGSIHCSILQQGRRRDLGYDTVLYTGNEMLSGKFKTKPRCCGFKVVHLLMIRICLHHVQEEKEKGFSTRERHIRNEGMWHRCHRRALRGTQHHPMHDRPPGSAWNGFNMLRTTLTFKLSRRQQWLLFIRGSVAARGFKTRAATRG